MFPLPEHLSQFSLFWPIINFASWRAAIHGVTKSQTRLSDWTELNLITQLEMCIQNSEDSLVRDEALGIIGMWANENHSNGWCLPERAGQRILNEEVIAKERGRGALGKVRGKPWSHKESIANMSSSKVRTEKSNHWIWEFGSHG